MRKRIGAALNRQVVMPRWAIALDFVYRAFLMGGAVIVLVLWFQAATRDEESDRNARIQSCASVYAATYSAWDSASILSDQHADKLFARLINLSRTNEDSPQIDRLLAEYEQATADAENAAGKASELSRRRIGLGIFSAQSVLAGNDFECPPVPADLMVEPIEP